MKNIRNFSIIAHIDHGKSTLSNYFIKICRGSKYKMIDKFLYFMDLERERGITIKSRSIMLQYKALNGKNYKLNFIDTPGHVDFFYEVSRSLSACEGAILLVDAGKGVEAQTLTNCYKALEMNLELITVLNKIDLPSANQDRVAKEIEDIIGIDATNIVRCSAKTGLGVLDVLERVVRDIPPPNGDPFNSLQALIIDSWFDNYLGVVSLVRIKNGTLRKGDKLKVMSTGKNFFAASIGVFTPNRIELNVLNCGEVGWIVCAIKDIHGAPVGDTLTSSHQPADNILPGFKKIKPKVYTGLFPINSEKYELFCDALNKLSLNDASLFYEPENSITLGFGFRCGFLGILHMEIIKERLKREYNIDIITTAPSVSYEVLTTNNKNIYIDSPLKLPIMNNIAEIREPIAQCNILLPKTYLGSIIKLCIEKRGVQINMVYHNNYVMLTYDIPMNEIIFDFFDKIKSISCGYASLEYEFYRFQKSDMVLIDILINGQKIDALSLIIHRNNALFRGNEFVNKLKILIPRHQFAITIQAAIGKHIIARSTINQIRKNVIAKCYGGDISRKKKLLQNQKKGKKRMKNVGNVKLPKKVFLAFLQIDKNHKYDDIV